MTGNAEAWLAARTPPPPESFDRWSEVEAVPPSGDAALSEVLGAAGLRDLDAALEQPGRVRAAAFDLLAADGFLTYACEAAAEDSDVAGALRRLLIAVGGGTS